MSPLLVVAVAISVVHHTDNTPQLRRLPAADERPGALAGNCEIGDRLWKSEKAIEKRISHVFAKLGLDASCNGRLDRRVTAARIFFACRPTSLGQPEPVS